MPLPDNMGLRRLLSVADTGPWSVETMDDYSPACGDTKRLWIVGDGGYFVAETLAPASAVACSLANFHLAALAPQLAEEVIRLRDEVDRLKWYCLGGEQVADAGTRLADNEREKAWQEGRAEAYYDTYLQITQGQRKENQ